jgi:hypothetical protein
MTGYRVNFTFYHGCTLLRASSQLRAATHNFSFIFIPEPASTESHVTVMHSLLLHTCSSTYLQDNALRFKTHVTHMHAEKAVWQVTHDLTVWKSTTFVTSVLCRKLF